MKNLTQVSLMCGTVALMLSLTACGNKEKKPGQALASVNGEEITVLQLNEELQRAGVQASQQNTASKQILESLIDRQLLQNEAAKDKTDRDPKVIQAIERAKALIVAQAYMQKRVGTPAKPTKEEIEDYYNKHPEFFLHRKVFDMRQLLMATADATDALKAEADRAKSLDEVASWLESNKINFARNQLSRSSADLAPELSGKLLAMQKGQLFFVREGDRTMLNALSDVREMPVALEAAAPQIAQFLFNKKNKEAADAEIARLRAAAKIEYFNKDGAANEPVKPAAPASGPTAAVTKSSAPAGDMAERGVAGLR